jgi:hypothetical protein
MTNVIISTNYDKPTDVRSNLAGVSEILPKDLGTCNL